MNLVVSGDNSPTLEVVKAIQDMVDQGMVNPFPYNSCLSVLFEVAHQLKRCPEVGAFEVGFEECLANKNYGNEYADADESRHYDSGWRIAYEWAEMQRG